MPQAEQGGLAGTSSSPNPLRWLRAWNRLVFSGCSGRRGVHSIVSNYLLSLSPQEGCMSSYCQGSACPFTERGRVSVPSPVGWGRGLLWPMESELSAEA